MEILFIDRDFFENSEKKFNQLQEVDRKELEKLLEYLKRNPIIEPQEEKSFTERKNKRISAMVSEMSLQELKELEEAIEIADRIIERLKY